MLLLLQVHLVHLAIALQLASDSPVVAVAVLVATAVFQAQHLPATCSRMHQKAGQEVQGVRVLVADPLAAAQVVHQVALIRAPPLPPPSLAVLAQGQAGYQ